MTDQSTLIEDAFQIISVRPAKAPENAQGSGWHCYVIAQGANIIRGYRKGNLAMVTGAVEEIVTQLNDRRSGKCGRVHLIMPRRKKSDNIR